MKRFISSALFAASLLALSAPIACRADSCAAKIFASGDGGNTGVVFRTSVFTAPDTTPNTNSTIYFTTGTLNFSSFYSSFSTYQDDNADYVAFGAGVGFVNGKTPAVFTYTLRKNAKQVTLTALITNYYTRAVIYSTAGALPVVSGTVTINL